MQEKLKAFIVSFELSDESELKNVAIIAYTKREAGDLFIAWATANKLYDKIVAIVVQRTKKTKRNKHMFTKDFYEKQKAHIDDMRKDGQAWVRQGQARIYFGIKATN